MRNIDLEEFEILAILKSVANVKSLCTDCVDLDVQGSPYLTTFVHKILNAREKPGAELNEAGLYVDPDSQWLNVGKSSHYVLRAMYDIIVYKSRAFWLEKDEVGRAKLATAMLAPFVAPEEIMKRFLVDVTARVLHVQRCFDAELEANYPPGVSRMFSNNQLYRKERAVNAFIRYAAETHFMFWRGLPQESKAAEFAKMISPMKLTDISINTAVAALDLAVEVCIFNYEDEVE